MESELSDSITNSADTAFLIFCGVLVLSMQLGFSLLEIGSVSRRNTNNIIFQNLMDASVGGVSFYLIGYAFAFGEGSPFIGFTGFAISGLNTSQDYAFWFLQFAFAATASSIVVGAIAERTKLASYFVFSMALTALVYPVVVHWVWSGTGWASPALPEASRLFGVGAIDFAGSTVVHSVGGLTALIACILLGARKDRFGEDGIVNHLPQQSTLLQTTGTLVLWIGWYGFNTGSALSIKGNMAVICGNVVVNMTISAATAGLTSAALSRFFNGSLDIPVVNNGILTGLVSVTAGCGVVNAYTSLIIGFGGAVFYFSACKLLLWLKIDDAVEAVPVHLAGGVWGTLAVGFFAVPEHVETLYGTASCGVLYRSQCDAGNAEKQLAAQVVIILANLAWSGVMATLVFGGLKLAGWLRVDEESEMLGLDTAYHGGDAYEIDVVMPKALPKDEGNEMTDNLL